MWTLLLSVAAASSSIEVTYEVAYDLPAMADSVCHMTKICDCKVTWRGTGQLVAEEGSRKTFRGTYQKVSGGCHDALELWAPADGAAFHTLRFSADGTRVTEWIAHARADATTRITSGTKAAGQVWISDMQAPLASGVARHQESESGDAGGIALKSQHQLTLRLK